MASPTLITPTSTPKSVTQMKAKPSVTIAAAVTPSSSSSSSSYRRRRREFLSMSVVSGAWLVALGPAVGASDEEYVKETEDVIKKVRTTITMEKGDPNVASAVADLRESSNSWVAKYRREKELLGRASFRDMYSVLNAVSGHYISFGPTAPIPAKRKARILEEVDTAQKALLRGR